MREVADSFDGVLQDTKQTLFTVPICLTFFIRSVFLVNDDIENSVTAELWIKRKNGTSSRRIVSVLSFNRAERELTFIPLRAGDMMEGRASVANKVHYFFGYVKQTET